MLPSPAPRVRGGEFIFDTFWGYYSPIMFSGIKVLQLSEIAELTPLCGVGFLGGRLEGGTLGGRGCSRRPRPFLGREVVCVGGGWLLWQRDWQFAW